MSRQIQIRRGTVAQHETFTGAVGELTFDGETLRVHDGTTVGGIVLARADEITTSTPIPDNADYVIETQQPTSANNYTWYRKYKSGWVEIGGTLYIGNLNDGAAGTGNISLPLTMANNHYSVSVSATSSESYNRLFSNFGARTTSGLSLGVRNIGGATKNISVNWCVYGIHA